MVVDADTKEVLRVVDEGAVPMPSTLADYDAASIGETREVKSPMHVEQPLGPGFDLDGNVVDWQGWRFHVRPDQRLGTVISTVTYRDGERRRPVLYQGSLSEIFVPYMDPAFSWYHRNFLDAGEYSAGGLTQPLMRGLDCPPHAVYLDGLVSGDDGRPHTSPNLICLFEREAGDMAWRHVSEDPESRVKRDLVARTAAVLGNYDYVFDWVFQQDGSIKVAIGATGISEVKMTAQPDAGPADPNDPTIGANSMPEAGRRLRPVRRAQHRGGQPRPLLLVPARPRRRRHRTTRWWSTAWCRASCRRTRRGAASGCASSTSRAASRKACSTWTCTTPRSGAW